MEFIILGLLHFNPMTGYEIGSFIKSNLALICSSSAGSVQSALKKLVVSGNISFEESVENGKNKKIFSITDKGREVFGEWIQKPMQVEKVKNMELSKLFFLGFAEQKSRREAIVSYIKQLQTVREQLIVIQQVVGKIKQEQLAKTTIQDTEGVLVFQNYTLQYGIDSAEFEINWYQKLLNEMEE